MEMTWKWHENDMKIQIKLSKNDKKMTLDFSIININNTK